MGVIIRALIFGSRHWEDYGKVLNIINRLNNQYFDDLIIIQGGCTGADEMAKQACIALCIDCEEYPADWKQFGKRAGPLRNQQMIDEGNPDMGICFHEDIENSKGSKDMKSRLLKANIPVYIIK